VTVRLLVEITEVVEVPVVHAHLQGATVETTAIEIVVAEAELLQDAAIEIIADTQGQDRLRGDTTAVVVDLFV